MRSVVRSLLLAALALLAPALIALPPAALIAAPAAEAAQTTKVTIRNGRDTTLYVSFTAPDAIAWGKGCRRTRGGAAISRGKTCVATVTNDNQSTRFCASTSGVPRNCWEAQTYRQTMVETNFQPSSSGGCFGQGRCVWYDISVIPTHCTDEAWAKNRCAGTGGASYNLPVSLGCGDVTEYTCRGPQTTKYGSARYPSRCGDPAATCAGGNDKACLNAYFYPMSGVLQPNTVCLRGQPLRIRFLAGE